MTVVIQSSLIFIRSNGKKAGFSCHIHPTEEFHDGLTESGLPDINVPENRKYILDRNDLWFDVSGSVFPKQCLVFAVKRTDPSWIGLRAFKLKGGVFVRADLDILPYTEPLMNIAKDRLSWFRHDTE